MASGHRWQDLIGLETIKGFKAIVEQNLQKFPTELNPESFRNAPIFSNLKDSFWAPLWGYWISRSWLEDAPLQHQGSQASVIGDNPCWSFGDEAWRAFDGDGRKCVINLEFLLFLIISISWKISQFGYCFSLRLRLLWNMNGICEGRKWYKYINTSRVPKVFLKLTRCSFKVRTLHKHFLTWF